MERLDEYCNSSTESRTDLGNGQVESLVISENTVDLCMFYEDMWFRFTLLVVRGVKPAISLVKSCRVTRFHPSYTSCGDQPGEVVSKQHAKKLERWTLAYIVPR